MKASIPILLYHHVAPDRDITPKRFDAQLGWLQDSGYHTVTLDELLSSLEGTATLPERSIVVTFDDGYHNNWEYAYPLLQKWKMKAMIYLVTERIGWDGHLNWDQIQAMAGSGLLSFGSHTHSHRGFVRSRTYENIDNELQTSKSIVEQNLSSPCRHLAWPWGDYETQWLPRAKAIGYASAATTLGGANAAGSSPYELRRIHVRQGNVDWLAHRVKWHASAVRASALGALYGWDRRFKVWWNNESPYSHG